MNIFNDGYVLMMAMTCDYWRRWRADDDGNDWDDYVLTMAVADGGYDWDDYVLMMAVADGGDNVR